jgi:hypothetical protein
MLVAGIVGWQRGVFHVVPGAVVVDARDEAAWMGFRAILCIVWRYRDNRGLLFRGGIVVAENDVSRAVGLLIAEDFSEAFQEVGFVLVGGENLKAVMAAIV